MGHWYTKDGQSRYDADLRTARKEGLLPSVTTIDKIIANEGLEQWKINQVIMSALTLPRESTLYDDGWLDDESDAEYINRIKADSMEQARKAARMGTVLHHLAERYASNKDLFFAGRRQDVWACFAPVKKWINNNIVKNPDYCETVLVGNGYAGKADYNGYTAYFDNEAKILLDYKSTFLTPDDIKKDGNIKKSKIYPSWGRQLSSLNKVANADIVMSVIISTNPEFTGVWIYEWSSEELAEAWIQFESAVKIYRSLKKL